MCARPQRHGGRYFYPIVVRVKPNPVEVLSLLQHLAFYPILIRVERLQKKHFRYS